MWGREEPLTCLFNNSQMMMMMMMFWTWGPHFEKQGCRLIKLSSNTWTKRDLCVHAQSCLFATLWTVAHQALLSPWNFPGRNTGVGCHFILQGIFLAQGLNLHLLWLLLCQTDSLPLSHQGSQKEWMSEEKVNNCCSGETVWNKWH